MLFLQGMDANVLRYEILCGVSLWGLRLNNFESGKCEEKDSYNRKVVLKIIRDTEGKKDGK